MYKVSVMYPNQEGARFDLHYYQTTHMDLVKKHLKPFGLKKADVDKGFPAVVTRRHTISASAISILQFSIFSSGSPGFKSVNHSK